jgi:nucleotide-binding universal stress UspA family protein
MTMIKNILFPVDFSPSCLAMASFVKREQEMFSAKVSLLYVLEPLEPVFQLLVRPPCDIEADRKQVAREKLDSFLAAEFPADQCARLLLAGDPALRIAELVRECNFDLIVMPTHAGFFRRTLLGSTTAKVLNDAECPVLTTQHAQTISAKPLEHREWICAIGLQPDSERVLRFAGAMAGAVHAKLTLVHAIPTQGPALPVQFDLEERIHAAEVKAARRRIDQLQNAVGSHVEVTVAVGPIKDVLTGEAKRLRADVVVIGRRCEPALGGRLRDLTYAVIRDAPCPVLSV